MSRLKNLKQEILADGKIDDAEVKRLKEMLYADGIIDKEEADFLFELNDAVSGRENASSWNAFFITAISDYLLKDEASPGMIDENEVIWLKERIGADGKVDDVERELLIYLINNTEIVPEELSNLLK